MLAETGSPASCLTAVWSGRMSTLSIFPSAKGIRREGRGADGLVWPAWRARERRPGDRAET